MLRAFVCRPCWPPASLRPWLTTMCRPSLVAVIAAAEFAMFALPVSIVQYLPTFFFGSLLVSE